MELDLGPCPIDEAVDWSIFAQRILGQIRDGLGDTDGDTSDGGPGGTGSGQGGNDSDRADLDLIELWSDLIDEWLDRAEWCERGDLPFRWSVEMDPERAEFLLAGLDRSLHSARVRSLCTEAEIERQRPFTVVVVRGFLDGLAAEGDGCRQYADHISASLRGLLPD